MVFLTSAGQSATAAVAFAVERLLDGLANQTTLPADDNRALQNAAQYMRVTSVSMMLGFAVNGLLCVALIWHLRTNRAGALRGDAVAAKKVILPAFEPVLIVLSVFNGAYMVFLLVLQIAGSYETAYPLMVVGALNSGNKFMALFVLVVLLQKSLSFPAVKRSVVISLGLAYYCMPYMYLAAKYGKPDQQKTLLATGPLVRCLHFIPFVYAFINPPHRATKRTIREFCFVGIVHFVFTVLINRFVMNPKTAALGRYVMYISLTMIALSPLVVWRVLKADTEYWRGIGQRGIALQELFQRENGLSERVSSEGLHALIEMNRKSVIDFAYLELVRQLGVGSTSTVFQGMLKAKTHVAVKVYAPTSCSEDVVAAFSHEAAMCRVLDHPNIVKFHGMCFAPPTICLVFQLCQGSLAATLMDQARRQRTHPARQQLLVSVGYMLDAARAVAYLHSFSPPFVHRDIKSDSFLVDAECNVQLSDFGESRCLTRLEQKTLAPRPKVAILEDKEFVCKMPSGSPCLDDISAEYAAPEVIEGKGEQVCYGEAADVYSLAVTMWEILHPSADRFPHANGDSAQVMEGVLHGDRPRMDDSTPPRLRATIERSWQREPGHRPSAKHIVAALEEVQEELGAQLVLELLADISDYFPCASSPSARSAERHHTSTFPGAFLADRMIDRRFVRTPAEATRMGNALMDSRVLHHVNHSRSFESVATAQYYFDLDEVQLGLQATGEIAASQNESSIPMLARGSIGGDEGTSVSFFRTRNDAPCQCRQLGQRLVAAKTSRFLRRKQSKASREPTADSDLLRAALLVDDDASHAERYHTLNIVSGTAASTA